jgi:integrase
MSQFPTTDALNQSLKHYMMRVSKTTGRQLSNGTARRMRYFMTPAAEQVFVSGVTGPELMRQLDIALEDESKSHRSFGMVMLAQFANYHGLLSDDDYKWWAKEGNRRFKPNKPVAERIIQRDTLKKLFDGFLTDDPHDFTAARTYCLAALLLLTGARHRAIVDIKNSDYTLTETEMTIKMRRLKSANNAPHTIHIPLDVLLPNGRPVGEAIYRYLNVRLQSDWFFMDVNNNHNAGLEMSMRHHLERHARYHGCGHITPHMFRFTCASIISDHVGLKQAQQLLGHSDMRTTLRYAGHFYDNVSRSTIANGFSNFANHEVTQ